MLTTMRGWVDTWICFATRALSHTRVRMECGQVQQCNDRDNEEECVYVNTPLGPSPLGRRAAQDVAVSSATGPMHTHVLSYFSLETGSAIFMFVSIHARKAGSTRRWCDPSPGWVKVRSQHHRRWVEAHSWAILPRYHGPP